MDTDTAFDEIRNLITKGQPADAVSKVIEVGTGTDDPMVRIKCLSLLKVIENPEASKEIIVKLMADLPEDRQALIQIAGALRGLEFPAHAYAILKDMEKDDAVLTLSCMCLQDLEEYEMALEALDGIQQSQLYDRVMRSEVLSAMGMHSESVANSEKLLLENPDDFDIRRAYVSSLMLAGRDKEAVRYVRGALKDKTAASNALAAYVMRITGNIKAAAGYATRALNMDQTNVSAMETLGICLAEKGEFDKARIVAGAINEVSPGSRAALNVLSYCDN